MSYEPAPFFRRLAARLVDFAFGLVLAIILTLPVRALLVPVGALTEGTARTIITATATAICYGLAFLGVELFLPLRRDGQSLGKGTLGLRVVPAAPEPTPRTAFLPALVRALIILAPYAFLALANANPDVLTLQALCLVILATVLISTVLAALPMTGHRALHDFAAGTRVVRAETRPIRWASDIPLMVPGKVGATGRS